MKITTEAALYIIKQQAQGYKVKLTETERHEYIMLIEKALGEMLQRKNGCYDD